jgi:hypothetical protein
MVLKVAGSLFLEVKTKITDIYKSPDIKKKLDGKESSEI